MAGRPSRTDNLDYNMEQSFENEDFLNSNSSEQEFKYLCQKPYQHIFKQKNVKPFMLKFDLAQSSINSIKKFQSRKCNFIRFRINFAAEKIEGDYNTHIEFPDNLSKNIPLLSSSVNLFRFNFNGKDFNLMIFSRITDSDFKKDLHESNGDHLEFDENYSADLTSHQFKIGLLSVEKKADLSDVF